MLPHRVVPLAQGFCLVPTTHELLDHLDAVHSSDGGPPVDGFIHLGGGLVTLLRLLSARAPVPYIETEYFGGAGTQSAAAYIDGEEVFAEGEAEAGHPINRALQMIGVRRTGSDEFDALGLVRFRNMGAF